jgi:hypothetical protein
MAPKKQGHQMAGSSAKRVVRKKQQKGHYPSYVRLRTILDSIEVMAIRYCLEGRNTREKEKREAEIEQILMPAVKALKRKFRTAAGDQLETKTKVLALIQSEAPENCPEGLNDCMGACVPYPCPL